MSEYKLTVVFQAEDVDEAHEQMDDAVQAFDSIVKETREDESGRAL